MTSSTNSMKFESSCHFGFQSLFHHLTSLLAKLLDEIKEKLEGIDLSDFATNGLSGYFLLALQVLNHQFLTI